MKYLLYIFVFIFLIGVLSAFGGYAYLKNELAIIDNMRTEETKLYTVKKGQQIGSVVSDLFGSKNINKYVFRFWLKENPKLSNIKAGTYEIKEGLLLRDVLDILVLGKEKSYNITLIEGGTLKDFLKVISSNQDLVHKLPKNPTYEDISQIIGGNYTYPEGLLLADTYTFSYGDDDISIIKRANKALIDFLNLEYSKRAKDLPYKNQYEALIMASIVEKETAVADERAIIASVFVNRLNKGIKLQTDPTVIYGVGERYKGKIYKSFLEDKNDYNTYVIDGLPKTPIAMPSRASITASLNPAQTDYLFFVAKGPDSREGHVFSKTNKEHLIAVKQYRESVKKYKKLHAQDIKEETKTK